MAYCLVDIGPGQDHAVNRTVYADPRLHYVGAGTESTTYPLLPDGSLVLDGGSITLPNPVTPALTKEIGRREFKDPAGHEFALDMTEDNASLRYYGPSSHDQETLLAQRYWSLKYADNGVPYDQFGPYNVVGGNETDQTLDGGAYAACYWVEDSQCDEFSNHLTDTTRSIAPNVKWGLEMHRAQLATNASKLRTTLGEAAANNLFAAVGGERESNLTRTMPRLDTLSLEILNSNFARPDAIIRAAIPQSAIGRPAVPEESPPGDAERAAMIAALGAAAGLVTVLVVRAYTRIRSKAEALEYPLRVELLRLVRGNEGLLLSHATRPLGITRTAVHHHARVLERAGLLRIMEQGRRVYLFTPESPLQRTGRSLPLHPVARRVMRAISDHGGSIQRDILHADLSEIPRRTRNYHLRLLTDAGLIETRTDQGGRTVVVDLSESVPTTSSTPNVAI